MRSFRAIRDSTFDPGDAIIESACEFLWWVREGSELALRQTEIVIEGLCALTPGLSWRIQVIRTTGDKVQDKPLARIGDKGLFVKEIEQALILGEIDFAVHSAKDLPSEIDDALCIAAYPPREDPSDVLVSKHGVLDELPAGARVGTSSLRRAAQLLHTRPDLKIIDLRGNLDTRLRKLDGPDYDAVVLASAGLKRLGFSNRATQVLPYDVCLPGGGAGRAGDPVQERRPRGSDITRARSPRDAMCCPG